MEGTRITKILWRIKFMLLMMLIFLFDVDVEGQTINGEAQIHTKVDGKKIIVTELFVRRDLRLADEEGIDCLPNSTIFEQLALMGKPKRKNTKVPQPSGSTDIVANEAVHKELRDRLVRAATTASSLEVEQDSGNIDKTQSKETPNESSSQGTDSCGSPRGNTLQSDEDRMKLNELMELCTTLQNRVLEGEKTKTSQHNEIDSLKRRVKKLKKRNKSRTHKLKRLYKVGLTARVETSDSEESLDDLGGEEVFVVEQEVVSTVATTETVTTEELTLAQALESLKTYKPNVKRIVLQEPSKSITITTPIPKQKLPDMGKGIMVEEPVKLKKKEQIRLDEEVALRLQAEFDEEERLVRERAQKEQEANIA
nr:hypothetical protein [Tanacetum cinerariifolium]